MLRTHSRNFRQQMFHVSCLSENPTVCRLHRTFAVGISDNKNLRAGSHIFRQQKSLSEIPTVCTQFNAQKFYACSESIRSMLGIIELHFSQLVTVLYMIVFLTFGIFDNICVTVCMQDKFERTSIGNVSTVLLSECPIVCTRHKSYHGEKGASGETLLPILVSMTTQNLQKSICPRDRK